MKWNFDDIERKALTEIDAAADALELETVRIAYLGRKGLIAQIYGNLAELSKEEKPVVGKAVNELKKLVTQRLEDADQKLKSRQSETALTDTDVTLPGVAGEIGHGHILTQTIDEICGLFESLGFVIQEGPEVETEFHNFDALNIPPDHPSRDGFDTFYVDIPDPVHPDKKCLLRSQTSPVQIRVMKQYQPPLAVIAPGKVYRPDAVDATHSFMFHQIEGLLVDQHVTFADLKGLLTAFCRRFFGDDVKMRFRPHFFPFTEPSAEVDISAEIIGKRGWLEIMGCGLVHPQVFKAAGYPAGKYTGLAFGLGIERIAMLKHGIHDIRLLYENDHRFLQQF